MVEEEQAAFPGQDAMKVVVDTNIIFSALLDHNSSFTDILTNSKIDFFIPKYAYIELFKYKEKIMKLTKHTLDEVLEILYLLMKRVDIFDEEIISGESLKKAFELVKDIDEGDLIFVALALELDAFLWTGDKKLMEGLKRKEFFQFFKIGNNY